MSERISLEFLAARLAAVQDGIRDLRDSHESFTDRVAGVEVTISNLGNQVVRTLALDNRRITRLDGRLDALARRMERLEEDHLRLAEIVAETREGQLRLGDMLADTRQELAHVATQQARMAGQVAQVAGEVPRLGGAIGRIEGTLAEVLRRLPPAPA